MSHPSNAQWLERAAECIDYFESKLPAKLIEKAIDDNDMEALQKYVLEAEAEVSRQMFHNYDVLEATDVY